MAKIKICHYNDMKVLEKEINEFIKDKTVIDIKWQTMALSQSFVAGHYDNFQVSDRVIILYEERG